MSKKQTNFRECWLSESGYKDWLQRDSNNKNMAKCKVCDKSFRLSNMGEQALKSHAKGAKHLSNVSVSCKLKVLPTSSMAFKQPAISSQNLEQSTGSGTVALNVDCSVVTEAECRWALNVC